MQYNQAENVPFALPVYFELVEERLFSEIFDFLRAFGQTFLNLPLCSQISTGSVPRWKIRE